MEVSFFEIGLKSATFLGVVASATALAMSRAPAGSRLRSLAIGITGVSLMVANAWVTNILFATLMVAAFLGGAGWSLRGVMRESVQDVNLSAWTEPRERLVEFSLVSKSTLR